MSDTLQTSAGLSIVAKDFPIKFVDQADATVDFPLFQDVLPRPESRARPRPPSASSASASTTESQSQDEQDSPDPGGAFDVHEPSPEAPAGTPAEAPPQPFVFIPGGTGRQVRPEFATVRPAMAPGAAVSAIGREAAPPPQAAPPGGAGGNVPRPGGLYDDSSEDEIPLPQLKQTKGAAAKRGAATAKKKPPAKKKKDAVDPAKVSQTA